MGATQLKRSIGLVSLTLYGLGTILGAGIYVLIGEISNISGIYSPLSFFVAAMIALFTAFSYAELSAQFPKSAGEAVYVNEAFNINWLSAAVGWGVVITGIVSAATITHGFSGYFSVFSDMPVWLSKIIILLILGLITAIGIGISVSVAVVVTLLEIGGLIWVISLNVDNLGTNFPSWSDHIFSFSTFSFPHLKSILLATFIAFYAFIGFEDMVNIAEEVKQPEKILPRAIIIAIILSTLLYALTSLTAILTLPIEQLAASKAPLTDLVHHKSPTSGKIIGIISMIAVINGALVQIIMASRVVYGMGNMNNAPSIFAKVNSVTKTPIFSTIAVTAAILIFTLWLPLVTLAKITSFVILIVFLLVNISLIMLKMKDKLKLDKVSYPLWISITASVLCGLLLTAQIVFDH